MDETHTFGAIGSWWPFASRPYQWHPVLYEASVWQKRALRMAQWLTNSHRYAREKSTQRLLYRAFKHSSKLIRPVNDDLMWLQRNKVQNLAIAVRFLDGIVIAPGETFRSAASWVPLFDPGDLWREWNCRAVWPDRASAAALCQISNHLHWLVLHTPLTVIERSHHGFDPFPDEGRVLPFGSGASVFWNYRDHCFRNETTSAWQVRLWLTDKLLEGELRCDAPPLLKYRVYEQRHRFFRHDGKIYRANELWREVRTKTNPPEVVAHERLHANRAEIRYEPREDIQVYRSDPYEAPR